MIIAYTHTYPKSQSSAEFQQQIIQEYIDAEQLSVDKWYQEDGDTPENNKRTESIIRQMEEGDSLVISDISRLSRNPATVCHLLIVCLERKIILRSLREELVIQHDENASTRIFALALLTDIERKQISIRAKESLAFTRNKGVRLGRPTTQALMERLLPHKEKIRKELKSPGMTVEALAPKYKVSPKTLNTFLKKYRGNKGAPKRKKTS